MAVILSFLLGVVLTIAAVFAFRRIFANQITNRRLEAAVQKILNITDADTCTVITVRHEEKEDVYGVICDEYDNPQDNIMNAFFALVPEAEKIPCLTAFYATKMPVGVAANYYTKSQISDMITQVQAHMPDNERSEMTNKLLEIFANAQQ